MNRPLPRSSPRHLLRSAFLHSLLVGATVHAASLVWDPANTTNGSTIDDGSGLWDLDPANLSWNNAGTNVAWTQTSPTSALHTAQFGGIDAAQDTYTVTLSTAVAVQNPLRFAASGYNLSALAPQNVIAPQITTNNGKIATLSGPLTVRGTTTFTFGGYGTLTLRDGANVGANGSSQLTFANGSKVVLKAGSVATTTGAIVVGNLNSDATLTQITIDGGTLSTTATSATNAIVLSNAGSGTVNTIVTLTSGALTNTSPGGGIRFGTSASGSTAGASTVAATINLDGGILTAGRLYEGTGTGNNTTSILNLNGGTLRAVSNTTNGSTFLGSLNAAYVKSGGAFIDSNGASIAVDQPLLADAVSTGGGLTKLGQGMLTVTGANSYTGPTIVSEGTLAFSAPYSSLTATTVSPNAKLRVTSGATASSLPALTLEAAGILELNLGVHDPSKVSSLSVGAFNAAGNYLVALSGTNIPTGDYTLLTYGVKSGSGSPILGSLPLGVTANVQDTGSAIILTVLTPQVTNYFWSAGTGNWDTSTANWTGQTYAEGALATFPDLAGSHTVTLTAPRSPFAVEIQNAGANSYTFTGSGISGSASVTKTGSGAATFSSANSYSGTTTLSAGALLVAADGALGSAAGGTSIATNAALGLTGGVSYASSEPIQGNGPGNLAAVGSLTAVQRGMIQSVGGHATFAGPITVNASGVTRFGTQDGASLTLSGTIAPAEGVTGVGILIRAGNTAGDFVTLAGSGNTWDLPTAVFTGSNSGSAGVRLGVVNGLSTSASVVASGNFSGSANAIDLHGFNQTLPGLVPSAGSLRITNLKPDSTSVLTLDTAAADFTNAPGTEGDSLTFLSDGGASSKVALLKKGSFRQTLVGPQTYSGTTSIEAGTLAFAASGSLGASPVVLNSGSTIDVSGITAAEFTLLAGLSGSGTVNATDKTLILYSSFAPGALAVTGNLIVSSGTATTLVAGASPATTSSVAASGMVTLAGTVAIAEAPGFDFASGQSFVFLSAGASLIAGLDSVSVNGTPLAESTPDTWTGTIGGLDYTFTEATGTLVVSGGVVIPPLQAWRDLHFAPPGSSTGTTGPGADNADPDGDGVLNLIEYIADTLPTSASANPVVHGTTVIGPNTFLTLTYPRRSEDPSLGYQVLVSTNLSAGFAPGTGSTITVGDISTYTDDVPVDPANPRRFLRLQVTAP